MRHGGVCSLARNFCAVVAQPGGSYAGCGTELREKKWSIPQDFYAQRTPDRPLKLVKELKKLVHEIEVNLKNMYEV